jgi:hypothetical protein
MLSEENVVWLKSLFLKSWRPYAWIAFLGFALYAKTIFFDFTYLDDNVLILDNINFLSNLGNIPLVFKQEVFHILHTSASYYRPILTLSFMLDAKIGGDHAWIYHLDNVVLHLIASLLVFKTLISLKYRRSISLLAAIIFVVHPVLIQAVAWIPGRNDSLLTIFALASFIFFIRLNNEKKILDQILFIFFFALAIFTKETALFMLVIFGLYYLLIADNRLPIKKFAPEIFGVVLIIAVWFYLRGIALASAEPGIGFLRTLKFFYLNSYAILLYIGKIFYPFNLSVLPILEDSNKLFGIAGIITLTLLIIFTEKRRWKYLIFSALWFLITLLPTFIRPNTAVAPDFIEHRVYLPMVGLMMILLESDLFKRLSFRIPAQFYAVIAVPLILIGINFIHVDNFKDRISFWVNAAANSPHSPLAHKNLGTMYYFSGYFDKAEIEYYKALELNPYESMVHNNLGVLYGNEGRVEEAMEEYQAELKYNPDYNNALFNLGVLKYRTGEKAEAEKLWLRTINANPEYAAAYQNLSVYYYESGNQAQGDYFYNKYLELAD